MEDIFEILVSNQYSTKVIWSIITIIVVILISSILKSILYKAIQESSKFYLAKRRINYINGFILFFTVVFIWADATTNLTTYLGLLSAGIAIALKEVFANIAGWLFIELRRPFNVGHRIIINNQKGDVIDKSLFHFTLMEVSSVEDGEQSTGRIIDIPNSFMFIHPLTNYTKGFEYIWNEIRLLVTFDSDWKLAKNLLTDIANQDTAAVTAEVTKQIKNATKRYMIHYKNLTPIVYTDIKEKGIQLTVRYLCAPKQRRVTANKIWEDILNMIEENDFINLA